MSNLAERYEFTSISLPHTNKPWTVNYKGEYPWGLSLHPPRPPNTKSLNFSMIRNEGMRQGGESMPAAWKLYLEKICQRWRRAVISWRGCLEDLAQRLITVSSSLCIIFYIQTNLNWDTSMYMNCMKWSLFLYGFCLCAKSELLNIHLSTRRPTFDHKKHKTSEEKKMNLTGFERPALVMEDEVIYQTELKPAPQRTNMIGFCEVGSP